MSGAGYYRYELGLTLEAPFLIAGSAALQYGVDAAQIRNVEGNAILPATHVRGLLRHAWTWLADNGASEPMAADVLFGKAGEESDAPGCLYFRDLVADNMAGTGRLTRVSIDDDTGAAQTGHLLTIEEVAGIGAEVAFSGAAFAFMESEAQTEETAHHLETAMRAIVAVGRFKTAGFGRVAACAPVTFEKIAEPLAQSASALNPSKGAFTYSFEIDSPLLVGISYPDDNTQYGAETIPGGAIKGALARRFKLAGRDPWHGDLAAALSRMRVSHAVPTQGGIENPCNKSTPLNFVRKVCTRPNGSAKMVSAVWPQPIEPTDERSLWRFQPDWKPDPSRTSSADFLARDVRTRVRIEAETGTAAEGALFTQSAVLPGPPDRKVTWKGTVSWPGDETGQEYDAFLEVCGQLADGVFSLGKLGTRTVGCSLGSPAREHTVGEDEFYVVTMRSPCLMIREEDLADEYTYLESLNKYWQEASKGVLSLAWEDEAGHPAAQKPPSAGPTDRAVFCQQEFRGGRTALQFRFFGARTVEPFVLCRPGSVFVLAAMDPTRGREALTTLRRSGLPAAEWDGQGVLAMRDPATNPVDPRLCPFGPQNGYGAFSFKRWEKPQ